MHEFIPYAKQNITEEDIKAVIDVLKSDWLTQGPVISEFENALSDYLQVNHTILVNNATTALHLACLVLNLRAGDYLWTSPISFVASANCGLYCGAKIDFIDINPIDYNICVKNLKSRLEIAKRENKLPKVLVVVHFSGQSCDMREIKLLSEQYKFHIIEDAAHAFGAKYYGELVGGCKYSDITVFSFHPAKIITTGEGGLITTNNAELYEKFLLLRSHGITRDKKLLIKKTYPNWHYEQLELGFNCRMTDFQAALGLSQLKRVNEFVEKRNELAEFYHSELKNFPLKTPTIHNYNHSSWHLYVILLNIKNLNKTRDFIYSEMQTGGIGVNLHYIPIYRQPYYKKFNYDLSNLLNAENYSQSAITLPLFFDLTKVQQKRVVITLQKLLEDSLRDNNEN